MKKVLVPLAQGFEEIEFVSIVDTLRRAQLDVITASLDSQKSVTGSYQLSIQADSTISEVKIESLDAICLAGGYKGMQNLSCSAHIIEIIQKLHIQNKLICAICASPIVLYKAGVIKGDFTCYPGCEENIEGTRLNQAVVKNANVITSAGPSTAIIFALEIVKELCGVGVAKDLYEAMVMPLLQAHLNTFAL